jgi:hypothetical protein
MLAALQLMCVDASAEGGAAHVRYSVYYSIRMLTYADVCGRMLTYAGASAEGEAAHIRCLLYLLHWYESTNTDT